MHVWHSPGGQKLGFTICRNIKYRKSPLGPHLFKKGYVSFKLTSEKKTVWWQLSPPVRASLPPPRLLDIVVHVMVDPHGACPTTHLPNPSLSFFSRSPPDAGKAHTIWLSLHFLAYGTSLSSVDPERMHLCSINPFSKCIGAVTRSCRCSCVCVALCCPQVFFLTAVSLGLSLPV